MSNLRTNEEVEKMFEKLRKKFLKIRDIEIIQLIDETLNFIHFLRQKDREDVIEVLNFEKKQCIKDFAKEDSDAVRTHIKIELLDDIINKLKSYET
jgi:hypothetical protein